MLSLSISDVAIITVKNVDCYCIIHDINQYEAIHLLKNSVLADGGYPRNNGKNWVYNNYFDNLIKSKKLEFKNIIIMEKTIEIWRLILLDVFTASR